MDLAPTRTSFGVDDRRWLRDTAGLRQTLGVTLDGSLFDSTRFPDGTVPSGTVVAQVTATRLWGPFDPAASDGRQTPALGKVGHLLEPQTVKPGRRNTCAVLDDGDVLADYLPTPPAGVTGAAAAIGVLTNAVRTALSRVRYTNGKAA
jgi:hypothetical protein